MTRMNEDGDRRAALREPDNTRPDVGLKRRRLDERRSPCRDCLLLCVALFVDHMLGCFTIVRRLLSLLLFPFVVFLYLNESVSRVRLSGIDIGSGAFSKTKLTQSFLHFTQQAALNLFICV